MILTTLSLLSLLGSVPASDAELLSELEAYGNQTNERISEFFGLDSEAVDPLHVHFHDDCHPRPRAHYRDGVIYLHSDLKQTPGFMKTFVARLSVMHWAAKLNPSAPEGIPYWLRMGLKEFFSPEVYTEPQPDTTPGVRYSILWRLGTRYQLGNFPTPLVADIINRTTRSSWNPRQQIASHYEPPENHDINGLAYIIVKAMVDHDLCKASLRTALRDFRAHGVWPANRVLVAQCVGVDVRSEDSYQADRVGQIELADDFRALVSRRVHQLREEVDLFNLRDLASLEAGAEKVGGLELYLYAHPHSHVAWTLLLEALVASEQTAKATQLLDRVHPAGSSTIYDWYSQNYGQAASVTNSCQS